jgi:succinate dehydrogenase hydrophobic anchor subunit
MYPRREVFYVRTTVRLIRPGRDEALEHDLIAVKVELARLWLLFVPTFLAVAFLVFFAAGGPKKFSFLNWIFSSRFGFIATALCLYPPLLVLVLLYAWIGERRVMRDAEACSASSATFSHSASGRIVRVSYLFVGEHGEYYAGDCMYFGLVHPNELATIVFHNVRTPELNKIAMGFLFHRLIVLGRGVTDLDKQTATTQKALAETASLS